jgi:hypothetical protein
MGRHRSGSAQNKILEYKVTCVENGCDWTYTTRSTVDLQDAGRSHRNWHYDISPAGEAKAKRESEKQEARRRQQREAWIAQKRYERSVQIRELHKEYERNRIDYEAFTRAESLRIKALSDMISVQEKIRQLSEATY